MMKASYVQGRMHDEGRKPPFDGLPPPEKCIIKRLRLTKQPEAFCMAPPTRL